jgi:hypothetical protein
MDRPHKKPVCGDCIWATKRPRWAMWCHMHDYLVKQYELCGQWVGKDEYGRYVRIKHKDDNIQY